MQKKSRVAGALGKVREKAREKARESRAMKEHAEPKARETAIDRFMPVADIVETRSVIVDAAPEATYEALKHIDFARVPSLLVRGLMAIGVAAVNRERRRHGRSPLPKPVKLTFDTMEQFGKTLLADEPGREIVIGEIARPGNMASMLEKRTPEQFEAFDCPGHIKAAGSFQIAPHGQRQTLLTYEARTHATDTDTRRKLFVADSILAPLNRLVMKRMIEYVKSATEKACRGAKGQAAHKGMP